VSLAAAGWSGNWRITWSRRLTGRFARDGGFNTFDFSDSLERPARAWRRPGSCRLFPRAASAARLTARFTASSGNRFCRAAPLPRLRPVLYNSWEATTSDVNETGQTELADKAAKLGVELFVMDDGDGSGARNDDPRPA